MTDSTKQQEGRVRVQPAIRSSSRVVPDQAKRTPYVRPRFRGGGRVPLRAPTCAGSSPTLTPLSEVVSRALALWPWGRRRRGPRLAWLLCASSGTRWRPRPRRSFSSTAGRGRLTALEPAKRGSIVTFTVNLIIQAYLPEDRSEYGVAVNAAFQACAFRRGGEDRRAAPVGSGGCLPLVVERGHRWRAGPGRRRASRALVPPHAAGPASPGRPYDAGNPNQVAWAVALKKDCFVRLRDYAERRAKLCRRPRSQRLLSGGPRRSSIKRRLRGGSTTATGRSQMLWTRRPVVDISRSPIGRTLREHRGQRPDP